MEAVGQLVQAMGGLSLKEKAAAAERARRAKLTPEQRAEENRRKKEAKKAKAAAGDAAALEAKAKEAERKRKARAAKKAAPAPAPEPEPPKPGGGAGAGAPPKSKEAEKKARQRAKAKAKPEPEPEPEPLGLLPEKVPEGYSEVEFNGAVYHLDPKTGFLSAPQRLEGSPYDFYNIKLGQHTYTLHLASGEVYRRRSQRDDVVRVSEPVGHWGEGPIVLANVPEDDQEQVEEVVEAAKPDWEEFARRKQAREAEARERDRIRREEEAMESADREFTQALRERDVPVVAELAKNLPPKYESVRFEESIGMDPEVLSARVSKAVHEFQRTGRWYDSRSRVYRDAYGNDLGTFTTSYDLSRGVYAEQGRPTTRTAPTIRMEPPPDVDVVLARIGLPSYISRKNK